MKARIYRPTKTAMQSGTANTRQWVLEYEPEHRRTIDPLMGWISSDDMRSQVRLRFDSRDEAVAYATRQGIAYDIQPEHRRKRHIRAYADNFK